MAFTRHGRGVRARLSETEAAVLAQLARELLELVAEPAVADDPLAAMVGMPPGEVAPPDDPVLARLLPDAYRQDPDAAGEFRRYTDADLRAGKRADAQAVLRTLPDGGGRMDLDRDQADRWLGCLNDMRLALGTALDVTEDTDPAQVDPDEPGAQALHIYGWLGYLQDSLLSCLEPRPPA